MIATILPGSSNFHAVGYNERKVAKGMARLLEIQNFGTLGTFGKPTPDEKVKYFQEYTSRNSRIQKAQFHVAVSCKGHEKSESELLEFTHQYLKEMGYAEPGQPLLVYSHSDTDNTHLHIVTSRVAPDGRKIVHDHERRRSQEVINRILGNDRKEKTDLDIKVAKEYTFASFAQFKAVMVAIGYEVYQKEGTVFIKHGGKVQQKLPLTDIETLYKKGHTDTARRRQLRSILKKYRDISTGKKELQKELKSKFGIDIVFFGKKDAPYGYMIVDHSNKTVIHGAKVLAVDELLDFATPEQRFDRVEDFIDRLLTLNPNCKGEGNTRERYRYWRISHPYSLSFAELFFFDSQGKLVRGRADSILYAAFDGNPLTNINRYDKKSLVIDFNIPISLSKIICLPRSDGNGIYPGNEYELFYHDLKGWKSLGRKIANGFEIVYDHVPQGALYWLHNHTTGIEERIFTVTNGNIRFW